MLARKALAGTAAAPKVYIEDVFSTYLYTGTGGGITVSNGVDLLNEGGLVWLKVRSSGSGSDDNYWQDTQRGLTYSLFSNLDSGQQNYDLVRVTTNNGFSDRVNWPNGSTVASWTFRKAKKFFDIVTYTGNGSNRTISHNLGSVPGCIMVKRTDTGANWQVYHTSVGNTKYFVLNSTALPATSSGRWNDTTPTSTVFSLGTNSDVNANGGTYVAYLFAHDAGGFGDAGSDSVISCGSYTGNGSATGPTVTLGWEPQWLLVKSTTVTGSHWYLMDTMRGMAFNGSRELYPNLTATDTAQTKNVIPTATGFQVETTDGYLNNNGSTYVYIAIRRGPMKTPTVGTSVFSPVAYTGTSAAQTITTNFPVDMFWNKTRVAGPGSLMDRTRGQLVLRTEADYSESNIGTYGVTTDIWRNNTGLSFGSGGSDGLNADGTTAVIEAFRRAPGFFDIVYYTGNASNRTINHNLGTAPELIIVKRRSAAISWAVYNQTIGNTKYLTLNADDSEGTDTTYWNSTSPTSSVFSVGTSNVPNQNSQSYVAYLFGSVTGVSKVGTYTGNGNNQTINCGFTGGARFVLIKRTDATGNWFVFDTARGIVSGNDPFLYMNLQNAEVTTRDAVDPDNSGFIVNNDNTNFPINVSTATYIYLAIA